MLEFIWWFFQLCSHILSLCGVFMIGVFIYIATTESYSWTWHQMIKRPLAQAKVRRRARKKFKEVDFSDSRMMQAYAKADVAATAAMYESRQKHPMYEGVYVFPEEMEPYSRHPDLEADDEVPGSSGS